MSKMIEWNKYIMQKKSIGKGSFAKVYYAYHKDTLVEVAIKKLAFNKLSDNLKERIIFEINILQKIDNINIIKNPRVALILFEL